MATDQFSRERSGHTPYSKIFGREFYPFEISTLLIENIYYASECHTKTAWRDVDADLIRGYNHVTRLGHEKPYVFVIGVVTDEPKGRDYSQFNLRITHSRRLPEELFSNIDYHLSLVLQPDVDDMDVEKYIPTLCSPKHPFTFRVTGINRKKKTIDAVADGIVYKGIAPPYVYNSSRIANMFHSEWGSSVIQRYVPDETQDIPLDNPKIIKFGRTEESDSIITRNRFRRRDNLNNY